MPRGRTRSQPQPQQSARSDRNSKSIGVVLSTRECARVYTCWYCRKAESPGWPPVRKGARGNKKSLAAEFYNFHIIVGLTPSCLSTGRAYDVGLRPTSSSDPLLETPSLPESRRYKHTIASKFFGMQRLP